jgi:hypothetical protein
VSGLDERRPARHVAPSAGSRRRFLLVVAVLVALASIPSLAVMLAGAASLVRPPAARSPFVAAGPDGPVQVDPGGQRGLGTRPPLTVEPARSVPPRRRPTTAARPARPAPMPEAAGGCTAATSPLPGTPSAEPSSAPAPEPSPVPERSDDGTELDLGLFRLRLR